MNLISVKEPNAILRLIKSLVYDQDHVSATMDYCDAKFPLPTEAEIKSLLVSYPLNFLYDALSLMIGNFKRPISVNVPISREVLPLCCYNWVMAELTHGMYVR